jgi:hypothetical protein
MVHHIPATDQTAFVQCLESIDDIDSWLNQRKLHDAIEKYVSMRIGKGNKNFTQEEHKKCFARRKFNFPHKYNKHISSFPTKQAFITAISRIRNRRIIVKMRNEALTMNRKAFDISLQTDLNRRFYAQNRKYIYEASTDQLNFLLNDIIYQERQAQAIQTVFGTRQHISSRSTTANLPRGRPRSFGCCSSYGNPVSPRPRTTARYLNDHHVLSDSHIDHPHPRAYVHAVSRRSPGNIICLRLIQGLDNITRFISPVANPTLQQSLITTSPDQGDIQQLSDASVETPEHQMETIEVHNMFDDISLTDPDIQIIEIMDTPPINDPINSPILPLSTFSNPINISDSTESPSVIMRVSEQCEKIETIFDKYLGEFTRHSSTDIGDLPSSNTTSTRVQTPSLDPLLRSTMTPSYATPETSNIPQRTSKIEKILPTVTNSTSEKRS